MVRSNAVFNVSRRRTTDKAAYRAGSGRRAGRFMGFDPSPASKPKNPPKLLPFSKKIAPGGTAIAHDGPMDSPRGGHDRAPLAQRRSRRSMAMVGARLARVATRRHQRRGRG